LPLADETESRGSLREASRFDCGFDLTSFMATIPLTDERFSSQNKKANSVPAAKQFV
jgi:hypothetical protein